MLEERYPFNDKYEKCSSRESAYLLDLEMKHMNIPEELSFPNLEMDIPPVHRERMRRIWNKVVATRSAWDFSYRALLTKWSRDVPETDSGQDDMELIGASRMRVSEEFKPALAMILDSNGHCGTRNGEKFLSREEMWKNDERNSRAAFYAADKNYLVAMRLYYEMLLEHPTNVEKDSDDYCPTFPLTLRANHPLRFKVVLENRYLRLIDAFHQAISIAKAATHQQGKGRIRKRENVPYVFHDVAVALGQLLDVVPFVIENKNLKFTYILSTTVGALHDLDEDSELRVADIENFLKQLADKYDSTVDPLVQSGFGRSRTEIKDGRLNLIRSEISIRLRKILMVLSKKTVLPRNLERKGRNEFEQSNAFKKYPEVCDAKLDSFFYRLLTLTEGKDLQIALIEKNEDRANNMETLAGGKVETQHMYLVATVTRLIAWQMLDHNQTKYPVYNSLGRLIDVTKTQYERFMKEFPDAIGDRDREYFEQLKIWQVAVMRYKVPCEVQRVLDEYDASRAQPQQESSVASSSAASTSRT